MGSAATDRISGTLSSTSVKAPCVAVATGNITLSGLQNVGGVTVAQGDRVLVIAQSSSVDNGIYIADTGDWQRAADFDGDRDAVNGTLVVVPSGGGLGMLYQALGTNPIVPGSSPITFVPRDNPNITYPQTSAEITAGIAPTAFFYPEGDVRRYGGLVSASDNSVAFTASLAVSGAGGNAAFIPGGVWNTTATITVAQLSSLHGVGNGSIIKVANAIHGLTFAPDPGFNPTARFFRDFQVNGTLAAGTNTTAGLNINLNPGTSTAVDGAMFQNIVIQNFKYGIYIDGAEYNTFQSCFLLNNYYGVFFNNQSVGSFLLDMTIQRGSITGTGGSIGISFSVSATEAEGIHIRGGSIYGYDTNISIGQVFELQLEHMDISNAQVVGVSVNGEIANLSIRDCWIETGNAAAITTGINLTAVQPSSHAKVVINGNFINCDFPFAGSTGIASAAGYTGMEINSNAIIGFDQGINISNACLNLTIKYNTIAVAIQTAYSASSYAILLNSASADAEIGPNTIYPGIAQTTSTTNGTTNILVGTAASSFPVGTPVQFSSTANGFTAGVTYFVTASSAVTISVASVAGGAAIMATGNGSIGNCTATPLPLTFNVLTPAGLTLFTRGKFIMTMSDPVLTPVCDFVASGKIVYLSLESVPTGAAATTTMTASGVPQYLAPNTGKGFMVGVENNTVQQYGYGVVATNGGLTLYPTPAAGAWNGSGTKGLLQSPMIWSY